MVRRPALVAMALMIAIASSVCGRADTTTPPITPTTTAPPAPAPTYQPISASCAGLPQGVQPAAACPEDEPPQFLEELNWAIDTLYDEHPEYFDGFRIHNVGAYCVGVIKILDRIGVCAYTSDGEEFGVKRDAGLGEQYDILGGEGTVRRPFYFYTCRPAHFPLNEPPLTTPPAGCTLAPSRSACCGEPPAVFYQDVEDAIDQLLTQRPDLFDHSDVSVGNRWPRITSMTAYQSAMDDALRAKGYCGLYGGEEISIKKGTNEFSEQYDIVYGDKYIRRGEGIYKGACYPAYF